MRTTITHTNSNILSNSRDCAVIRGTRGTWQAPWMHALHAGKMPSQAFWKRQYRFQRARAAASSAAGRPCRVGQVSVRVPVQGA